ncbi:MAG: electron transfer flavoprotein subunit beta/FixA family protein [Candidatus Bathyarchaeota archaeon]|nr:MAG: electron transfer flavoprotein subunit beta/FixA family protein [Candidatus Bathyarchaeota archaeon]
MDIIVCVKQTPETAEAELRLDDSGKSVKTAGLVFEMNEWDEYAIEEALLLKERLGGSVTALTMGPEGADAVLRRCLAKGADRAMWLKDEAFKGSDAYATAKTLHAAIKDLEFDLVLAGTQASDDGYSAVGVILAELLGVPHASMVKNVDVGEGRVIVNRELEGGLEEVVDLGMPAVLTVQTGINEPRYVSIMGIRRARKKEMALLGLGDLGLTEEEVGARGSWLSVERMYRPPVEKEPIIMAGSLDEVARKLAELFRARGLI